MHDIDDYPQARTIPGLVVYRYDSPLFFANAEDFRHRALAAVADQEGPVEWFVLNTEANVEVNITALDSVAEGFKTHLIEDGSRGVNLKRDDVTRSIAEMRQKGVDVGGSHAVR